MSQFEMECSKLTDFPEPYSTRNAKFYAVVLRRPSTDCRVWADATLQKSGEPQTIDLGLGRASVGFLGYGLRASSRQYMTIGLPATLFPRSSKHGQTAQRPLPG